MVSACFLFPPSLPSPSPPPPPPSFSSSIFLTRWNPRVLASQSMLTERINLHQLECQTLASLRLFPHFCWEFSNRHLPWPLATTVHICCLRAGRRRRKMSAWLSMVTPGLLLSPSVRWSLLVMPHSAAGASGILKPTSPKNSGIPEGK